jgi:hypothetical protein
MFPTGLYIIVLEESSRQYRFPGREHEGIR